MKRTKIICTIGPASESPEKVKELLQNGANVVRLNFSHGDYEEHKNRIELVKKFRREMQIPVAILLDTKGPEIRLGKFKDKVVVLKEGQSFTLTTKEILGDENRVSISYSNITQDVSIGSRILLDDGLIELNVDKIDGTEVYCKVINGGVIGDHKGVNLPGTSVSLPPVTDKDIRDIKFGIENDIDYIAASFVRSADDVREIRRILGENGGEGIQIIAKIENQQGVDNIEDIIKVADGIMIARGDLGVEIPTEDVPVVQKQIIYKCVRACKPVIIATQMLDSMIRNPRPTRAEASDVANAIYDGADAIMLSGETAAGKYPIEALATMCRIAERMEANLDYKKVFERCNICNASATNTTTSAISHATSTIADDLNASAIITPTQSGYTARMVSRYRPKYPIIATTTSECVYRKLALIWGVMPYMAPDTDNTDDMIDSAVEIARKTDIIQDGDIVIITAGVPAGLSGTTNLIKVHTVGY